MQCIKCERSPAEIGEYCSGAIEESVTPEEFVRDNEGTLNHSTGLFWCTACYIAVGMPLGTAR